MTTVRMIREKIIRTVLCCIVCDTHTHMSMSKKLTVGLGDLGLLFLVFFAILFPGGLFVLLCLVFLLLSQEIAEEECLQNDLFHIKWDAKP